MLKLYSMLLCFLVIRAGHAQQQPAHSASLTLKLKDKPFCIWERPHRAERTRLVATADTDFRMISDNVEFEGNHFQDFLKFPDDQTLKLCFTSITSSHPVIRVLVYHHAVSDSPNDTPSEVVPEYDLSSGIFPTWEDAVAAGLVPDWLPKSSKIKSRENFEEHLRNANFFFENQESLKTVISTDKYVVIRHQTVHAVCNSESECVSAAKPSDFVSSIDTFGDLQVRYADKLADQVMMQDPPPGVDIVEASQIESSESLVTFGAYGVRRTYADVLVTNRMRKISQKDEFQFKIRFFADEGGQLSYLMNTTMTSLSRFAPDDPQLTAEMSMAPAVISADHSITVGQVAI